MQPAGSWSEASPPGSDSMFGQLDDIRLVVSALLQQPPAGEALALAMSETVEGLDLRIGPFAPLGAEAPALERTFDPFVDDFAVEGSERGDWIAVTLNRRSGRR